MSMHQKLLRWLGTDVCEKQAAMAVPMVVPMTAPEVGTKCQVHVFDQYMQKLLAEAFCSGQFLCATMFSSY